MIDVYKKLARNWLKKTGDTMIDPPQGQAFLTLAHDPVNPLHAVTKEYVDGLVGSGVQGMPYPIATNRKYSSQYGGLHSGVAIGNPGDGKMGILFTGGKTHTWNQLSLGISSAGTGTVRLALYQLDPNTLLPTALLFDAGTVALTPATEKTLAISPAVTTTAAFLGLATICETTGSGQYLGAASNNDASTVSATWFGTSSAQAAGGLVLQVNVLFSSTGIAGAPAPGAWSVPPTSPQTFDGGVYITKSA